MKQAVVWLSNRAPSWMTSRLGGSTILASLLRPIANRILPSDPVDAVVRSGAAQGIRLRLFPKTEKYYWTGTYEPAVQRALRRHLKPGDVMWDIGAHIGYHTAIASRIVGPTGRVVAFEPLPATLERLRWTVAVNQLTNVVIRDCAVASAPGRIQFFEAEESSMAGLQGAADNVSIDVDATTLDAELEQSQPPTLVKIDVEGAELLALAGAKRLVSTVGPTFILEVLDSARATAVKGSLPGYRFEQLDPRNLIAEWPAA